jgi:hypothetical protein
VLITTLSKHNVFPQFSANLKNQRFTKFSIIWRKMPLLNGPVKYQEYLTFIQYTDLKVNKHEIFFKHFFTGTESLWSQGPVTRDFLILCLPSAVRCLFLESRPLSPVCSVSPVLCALSHMICSLSPILLSPPPPNPYQMSHLYSALLMAGNELVLYTCLCSEWLSLESGLMYVARSRLA